MRKKGRTNINSDKRSHRAELQAVDSGRIFFAACGGSIDICFGESAAGDLGFSWVDVAFDAFVGVCACGLGAWVIGWALGGARQSSA
ncbi:hypothetical protein D3C78_1292840 [compost metagenome]